jgi:hypothetical protein
MGTTQKHRKVPCLHEWGLSMDDAMVSAWSKQ